MTNSVNTTSSNTQGNKTHIPSIPSREEFRRRLLSPILSTEDFYPASDIRTLDTPTYRISDDGNNTYQPYLVDFNDYQYEENKENI